MQLVFRPRIRRPFVYYLCHINEPRINHLLLISQATVCKSIDAARGVQHGLRPLVDVRVVLERIVNALRTEHNILQFEPAARLEVFETLTHEPWPIANGPY